MHQEVETGLCVVQQPSLLSSRYVKSLHCGYNGTSITGLQLSRASITGLQLSRASITWSSSVQSLNYWTSIVQNLNYPDTLELNQCTSTYVQRVESVSIWGVGITYWSLLQA